MDDKNKVKPEKISGTVTLGSIITRVGIDAVGNNESTEPSEEFIESLKKGAKENVFSTPQDQNDK